MTLFKRRSSRKRSLPGAWLAFLAAGVQVLLPFLVAYEIALASDPAYADNFTAICSSSGIHSQLPGDTRQPHHGMSDGCPICTAMAAGQAFTTPGPVALPLPRVVASDVAVAPVVAFTATPVASPYQSRAPPPSV
jgi:hypothetical protein